MVDKPKTHQHPKEDDDRHENHQEALRLKTLAESKFNSSALKSAIKYATRAHRLSPTLPGLSELLTALQIFHSAATTTTEFYGILGLDPFSPLRLIKSQYKKFALILHPDKSTLKNSASEEAFKLVNDAFQVLSDRIRRKEYDTKLRLALQSAAAADAAEDEEVVEERAAEETVWTACDKCGLLHQFERRYVGHSLVCPNCNEGFKAIEVEDEVEDEDDESNCVRRSARVRVRKRVFGIEQNSETGNVKEKRVEEGIDDGRKIILGLKAVNSGPKGKMCSVNEVLGRAKSKRVKMIFDEGREVGKKGDRKHKTSSIVEGSSGRESPKRGEEVERELTLAEIKLAALKKSKGKKKKIRKESEETKKGRRLLPLGVSEEMEVMVVQDSDFYDFDEDRVERSFKKGQVWAIYDDDDGMPRHYGLIEEVVSVNPFQVRMSWLDLQNNGDERLISWEKMGFHVSCGKFKVARKG